LPRESLGPDVSNGVGDPFGVVLQLIPEEVECLPADSGGFVPTQ
jgi:hypothetical protein